MGIPGQIGLSLPYVIDLINPERRSITWNFYDSSARHVTLRIFNIIRPIPQRIMVAVSFTNVIVTTQAPKSCKTGSMQFMLRPMNFHLPTDEDIHTAFAQGEAAVMVLFHDVAAQVTELAQQLAKQGALLHELQARLAKTSRNSSKPPASDGYGKMKRTESLREPGQQPTGGQPGHDGHTLMAAVSPDQTLTHAVSRCAYCQASLQDVEHMGYEERQV